MAIKSRRASSRCLPLGCISIHSPRPKVSTPNDKRVLTVPFVLVSDVSPSVGRSATYPSAPLRIDRAPSCRAAAASPRSRAASSSSPCGR